MTADVADVLNDDSGGNGGVIVEYVCDISEVAELNVRSNLKKLLAAVFNHSGISSVPMRTIAASVRRCCHGGWSVSSSGSTARFMTDSMSERGAFFTERELSGG